MNDETKDQYTNNSGLHDLTRTAILQGEDDKHFAFLGFHKIDKNGNREFIEPNLRPYVKDAHCCGFLPLMVKSGSVIEWDTDPHYYHQYRLITNKKLRMSAGSYRWYEVLDDSGEVDTEVTTDIFGATAQQATDFGNILGSIRNELGFYYHPEITFSSQRVNFCKFTGKRIPKNFPYLKLGIHAKHVSLTGYYKYCQKFFTDEAIE